MKPCITGVPTQILTKTQSTQNRADKAREAVFFSNILTKINTKEFGA